jgi:hypothetical protein
MKIRFSLAKLAKLGLIAISLVYLTFDSAIGIDFGILGEDGNTGFGVVGFGYDGEFALEDSAGAWIPEEYDEQIPIVANPATDDAVAESASLDRPVDQPGQLALRVLQVLERYLPNAGLLPMEHVEGMVIPGSNGVLYQASLIRKRLGGAFESRVLLLLELPSGLSGRIPSRITSMHLHPTKTEIYLGELNKGRSLTRTEFNHINLFINAMRENDLLVTRLLFPDFGFNLYAGKRSFFPKHIAFTCKESSVDLRLYVDNGGRLGEFITNHPARLVVLPTEDVCLRLLLGHDAMGLRVYMPIIPGSWLNFAEIEAISQRNCVQVDELMKLRWCATYTSSVFLSIDLSSIGFNRMKIKIPLSLRY